MLAHVQTIQTHNYSVSVPEVQINLSQENLDMIKELVDPLGESDNFRMDLYSTVLNLIQ